MGCFRLTQLSSLEIIFYALSLMQLYRGIQLAGRIRQDWSGFKHQPLTRQKMHMVEQAAFYLAIPPSVLVHEIFHAIPIWQLGGRIVNCGYGFYWGFVQPDRFFAPSQEWFISLAGTLGSLLFALFLFAILYRNRSQALRYFGRQSLRTLLHFSLIYYPIFTAVTFIGDWRVIYDFTSTPVLSAGTAVVHILLLLLFWRADRRGWFETVGHQSAASAEAFAQLEENWRQSSQDPKLAVEVVNRLRLGGANQKSLAAVQQAIRQHPNEAELYLQLALIQKGNKGKVPKTAVINLEKALQLRLSDLLQQATAHHLLGQYQLDKGQGEAALQHLEKAARIGDNWTDSPVNPLFLANVHHLRSLAYQRLHQPEMAIEAARKAITIVQEANNEEAVAFYEEKLAMIENWNGRRP